MPHHLFLRLALAGCLLAAPSAFGQKGTGASTGVAASGDRPEIVSLSGTVTAIKEAPCEKTTGRSPMGMHLMLDTDDGPINLHLGPLAEMTDLRNSVREGATITTDAFRTDALPDGAFIAVSVTAGEVTHQLRDATTLRPRWARGSGRGGGRGYRYGGGRCW